MAGLPDLLGRLTLDTSQVAPAVGQARDELGRFVAAGDSAGDEAGGRLGKGILGALVALPIAGAVVGIGVAVGKALVDGLQNEVREDLLAARTGLDPGTAAKVGRAAGEAYGNNFGESIEANMDNARAAIQAGLIDPTATQRDIQDVIEQVQGVADIMGEEVPAVARAAAQAIKTGIADDAAGAFDLLVKGTQAGLNVSEDLLDTFTEYGTSFRALGLEGPEALGLLSQAVRAGARDTDIAADAFKEFGIRAKDVGDAGAIEAYKAIGLNAEEMQRKVATGGREATEVLRTVLERIAAIEDPAQQTAVAVGLFGTQAEDLAGAFAAFDLSTAVQQLGAVEGAARGAISTLGANSAGELETARRNIEVAIDGVQGALAQAFAPEISSAAAFVTENREAVVGFLLDAANAAFDLARALVNAAADGTEGFGAMVATVGPQVLGLIESLLEGLDSIPFVDMSQAREEFKETRKAAEEAFANFEGSTVEAADAIRTNIIENGIDPAQERLNAMGDTQIANAAFHDATVRLANDVAGIGFAADGSRLQLGDLSGGLDLTSAAGKTLDEQIRTATEALRENLTAAANAGAGTDELTATFKENRQALVDQLTGLGLSAEAANTLADRYGAVPGIVDTLIRQPGMGPALDTTRRYKEGINTVPTRRDTTFTARSARVVEVARELDTLARERIARVRVVQTGDRNLIGDLNARAGGGPVYPGLGLTLVGEEGPELVAWGGNGQVIPADVTRALLDGARTATPQGAAPGVVSVASPPVGAGPLSVTVLIGGEEFKGYVDARVDTALGVEGQTYRLGRV